VAEVARTRYSRKREAILATLRSTDAHPTAEWLYQTLKAEYQDLSLGTVYRNLALFQEQGLVRSVGVVDGYERFDACTQPHSHFVCQRCHTVTDLPELVSPDLDRTVSAQYGSVVQRHDLIFYGVCQTCSSRKNEILKEEASS